MIFYVFLNVIKCTYSFVFLILLIIKLVSNIFLDKGHELHKRNSSNILNKSFHYFPNHYLVNFIIVFELLISIFHWKYLLLRHRGTEEYFNSRKCKVSLRSPHNIKLQKGTLGLFWTWSLIKLRIFDFNYVVSSTLGVFFKIPKKHNPASTLQSFHS